MNIIIRRMKSSDADALYRLLSDPEVMRYLEPLYDRAQTEAFLHRAGLSEPPLVYAAEGNGRFIIAAGGVPFWDTPRGKSGAAGPAADVGYSAKF